MSSFYDVTSSGRWLPPSKKPLIGYVPFGPTAYATSWPTGQPFDTYHAQYPKTPITASFGSGSKPTLRSNPYSTWVGVQGSSSAQPLWLWTSTSNPPITSYAYTITKSYNNYPFGDPGPVTTVATGTLGKNATSVGLGAGVFTDYGYLFQLILVATNALGTKTFISAYAYNSDANVIFSSFSFAGTAGSTNAQPTWNWTNTTGSNSRPDTLAYALYSDTFTPPTTLIAFGSLPAGYNVPYQTSYAYTLPTVISNYYKFVLTCNNNPSPYVSFSNTQQNVGSPTVTFSSFSYNGFRGSTTAKPTWTWAYGGGPLVSVQWYLYGDSSATPTTVLASGTSAITSYQYTGATVGNYYYSFQITATNAGGSDGFTNIAPQNWTNLAPTVTDLSATTGNGTTTPCTLTFKWTGGHNVAAITAVYFYSFAAVYGGAPTYVLTGSNPATGGDSGSFTSIGSPVGTVLNTSLYYRNGMVNSFLDGSSSSNNINSNAAKQPTPTP
jgi:hypothetical protein